MSKSPNQVKRYLLTPDQIEAIKAKAKELDVSESAIVREILELKVVLKFLGK